MDQLAALRALRRVVELGSFTAAADALGISHTIVSRQIRQLESHLGAQLLNRTTRRFALTDAGRGYYEACRHILDALDDADRAVGHHQAQPGGTLRINAPMAFGTLELAGWLPRFIARYPQLQVDLVCNDRIVDLIGEGFDVALRLTRELPDSTLVARRLATSPILPVASPDYLRRHGTPASPDDLVRHNCLCYTLAERPFDWTFELPVGGHQTVHVGGNLQANTGVALRSAALAGLGIASSAEFIVRADLRSGDLVPVLPAFPMRPRELYALYPQSRHLAPKVRAFIDFAAEHYEV
ncbi:DNA-binding transcriptional LysR family regulator [Pseudoduganella lurida]|uniref:DNA-binding transcriptional LysR family regulator n=1 Tax=Pseudoduganella lurida TaxID=1036180 RepID=A0A562R3M7_9BURK|nr:LysR family transcriptional regulator [Pseudoduganella lurida]TWI63682.1 DNA-binding transcriptional LysR family regulator [Pseudoduganella lurida]